MLNPIIAKIPYNLQTALAPATLAFTISSTPPASPSPIAVHSSVQNTCASVPTPHDRYSEDNQHQPTLVLGHQDPSPLGLIFQAHNDIDEVLYTEDEQANSIYPYISRPPSTVEHTASSRTTSSPSVSDEAHHSDLLRSPSSASANTQPNSNCKRFFCRSCPSSFDQRYKLTYECIFSRIE